MCHDNEDTGDATDPLQKASSVSINKCSELSLEETAIEGRFVGEKEIRED